MAMLAAFGCSGGTGTHLQPTLAKQPRPPVLPGTPRAWLCWGVLISLPQPSEEEPVLSLRKALLCSPLLGN